VEERRFDAMMRFLHAMRTRRTDVTRIFNDGDLTLDGLCVRGNSEPSARPVRSGGGILHRGTATVREGSAIRENGASFGGAGIINSDGSLTLHGAIIEKNETNGWHDGLRSMT
jgi:hypothetical protein